MLFGMASTKVLVTVCIPRLWHMISKVLDIVRQLQLLMHPVAAKGIIKLIAIYKQVKKRKENHKHSIKNDEKRMEEERKDEREEQRKKDMQVGRKETLNSLEQGTEGQLLANIPVDDKITETKSFI